MPSSYHFLFLCLIVVGHTLADHAVDTFMGKFFVPAAHKTRPMRPPSTKLGVQSFSNVPVVSSGAEAQAILGNRAPFVNIERAVARLEEENFVLKSELHQFRSQIEQMDVLKWQKQEIRSLWAADAGAAATLRCALCAFLAGSVVSAIPYYIISKVRSRRADLTTMDLNLRDGDELKTASAGGVLIRGRSGVPMMTAEVAAKHEDRYGIPRVNEAETEIPNPIDEEPEEVVDLSDGKKLEPIKMKNYAFSSLLEMEEDGDLCLRPFYQRGFKWTQKQASLWIESMLRGYPCLPEITLLETDEGYTVFDGQQRLTTVKLFLKGERGDGWKTTAQQRKAGTDKVFALEGLALLSDLEGLTFKDLAPDQQKYLRRQYDIRCAIIPATWTMADYIDFFKRIQGGGTPMTEQELRRAITRGPFTTTLDDLADPSKTTMPSKLLHKALAASKLDTDEKQELLLRYFRLQSAPMREFGKPSLSQQGLQLMKHLNAEATTKQGSDNLVMWIKNLEGALEVALKVFPKNEERFRRAAFIQHGMPPPTRVWISTDKVNRAAWDCVLYSFSKPEKMALFIQNASAVRDAAVDVMQTHPSFESINIKGTEDRIIAFDAAVQSVLPSSEAAAAPVSRQTRLEMIVRARDKELVCPLCEQPLPVFDDLVHIDHRIPRARGGSSDLDNLQVVCKRCNLEKRATVPK